MKRDKTIILKIFNNGYLISLLMFLCGSLGSLCDGIIASKALSIGSFAAIGISYPYVKIIECISKTFSTGSQVCISRKIGQNRFDDISRVFFTSLLSLAVIGAAVAAVVVTFSFPISRLLGAREKDLNLLPTVEYLQALAIGAPAHLLTLYLIPLFQLDQKQKLVNFAAVVMTVTNIFLNLYFAARNMGINGIGLSTSISYYLSLLVLCTHFIGDRKGILLRGKPMVKGVFLLETVKEGISAAFKDITAIVHAASINNILALFGGAEALAAYSVMKTTQFIFLSVSEALCNPVRMVQTMLCEEKDIQSMRSVFRYAMTKGLGLSGALALTVLLFGRSIFSVMVSGAVLDETVSFFRWYAIVMVFNVFTCYYVSYFQAINEKPVLYSVSVVLNIVSLPVIYFLAWSHGALGIWIGYALKQVIAGVYVFICAYLKGRRNPKLLDRLLALPCPDAENYRTYDYHIASRKNAAAAAESIADACKENMDDSRKVFCCSLAMEEIIFNILDYQESIEEKEFDIDVHILFSENNEMLSRIKDNSSERNPFAKYTYSKENDLPDNIGIRLVGAYAKDVRYSFIYGVNFITVRV